MINLALGEFILFYWLSGLLVADYFMLLDLSGDVSSARRNLKAPSQSSCPLNTTIYVWLPF